MKKVIALIMALCMVLSMAVVASAEEATTSINVGLNSAPVGKNIWYQNDLNSATIVYLCSTPLVAMDENGVKYNYLSESATSNDAGTEWTVKIREELTWNDGTPVTANDLLFTARYGTEHHIGFFDSYYGAVDFEASQVLDEHTVLFKLTSANVNFWQGAGYWIPLMRESEWKDVEDPTTYEYSGDGYGPYYIKEWVDGEYVILERNPYFTLANDGQGALIDQIIFRVYTDENAMVLALQNGEIDVCANFLSNSSVTQLQNNPNYLISSVPSLGYAFMSFSQSNELLQDINVRKAISMCANRDALVAIAFAGGATAMHTPISPVYSDFVASDIRQPAYDPAGAAELLKSAGYADNDGDGILESASGAPLSFKITYKSTLQNVDGVMSILQAGMKEAGIELVLQPVDAATFSANVTQGHTYDISYSSWGTIDDVDTTLLTCFGIGQTLNFMEFNSEEQEALLTAMQAEPVYEKRVELLNQWQSWFVENLPTCHLLVPNNTYVANTENYEGWGISYGNSAYMEAAHFVNVKAK